MSQKKRNSIYSLINGLIWLIILILPTIIFLALTWIFKDIAVWPHIFTTVALLSFIIIPSIVVNNNLDDKFDWCKLFKIDRSDKEKIE